VYCCLVTVTDHAFSGHYDEYYGLGTDVESLMYLMLANHMLHKIYPSFMVTIAEVSCHCQCCCYVHKIIHIFKLNCSIVFLGIQLFVMCFI